MSWEESANCAGADPGIFYPRPVAEGGAEDIRLGKEICGACPVKEECLEAAVELGDVWGWRAGTSPNQIKAMVVERHGSAPLEGFGTDWHERNSAVLDGKTPQEIKEHEATRVRARNWYRAKHGLDETGRREEERAWEVPDQRQPERDRSVAEVA